MVSPYTILNYHIEKINDDNISLIKIFLDNAGNSLNYFRYFTKRPISIIKNHIVTGVILLNLEPVGYGHLDLDTDKIWLGIAINEKFNGKGLGTLMMNFLISTAKIHKIKEIYLSVDKNNEAAIKLYTKFKFKIIKESDELYYIMKLIFEYD